jgi:hypothetical protein
MNRLRLLFSAGSLVVLGACGGGSGGSSNPTTPTVPTPEPLGPAVRTVLDSRSWFLRGGAGVFYNQDRLPEGTLDVTMEWSNGDVPVSVYVTEANSCPDTTSLRNGACRVVAQSVDPKVKPKTLSIPVNATKPSLAVWVVNEGRNGADGSMEVAITSREKPATPAPGATPTPGDVKSTLPDGPVSVAFIKVRSIDQGNQKYRDPFQDRDGYWVVYNGEFVVFDLTQKNGSNQECKWVNDPTWEVDDPGYTFQIKGSSQPFLLRVDVTKDEGVVEIVGKIDGVTSNLLKVKAKKP